MNALELIKKRCSIRSYQTTPIEHEKLSYIVEAAQMSPSAVNYQPCYFLVITEEEGRKKVAECYPREWIKSAPAVIAVCGDHSQSWKRQTDGKDHLDVDAGIAIENICLAATSLDLATCIVCHFDTDKFHDVFDLPESVEPIALIPVAYPSDPDLFEKTPKKRKSLNEVVKWERF